MNRLLAATWPAALASGALGLACGPLAAGATGGWERTLPVLLAGVPLVAAAGLGLSARPLAVAAAAGACGLAFGAWRAAVLEPPAVRAVSGPVTVIDAPREERFGWRAVAQSGRVRVLLRGRGKPPAWEVGDMVRAAGPVRPPGPGDGWLRARHVLGVVSARAGPVVGRRGGLEGWVDGIRRRAEGALASGTGPQDGSLLRGMVLGDDSAMSPGLRSRMRSTGLGHLVAASGSNVALLVALVLGACALAGTGRLTRLGLAGGAVVVYALLCGSGPSILRAAVMGLATLAAAASSRPASRWHALLLAALVTLALDPGCWRDAGWQLSFAAVTGIGLLAAPVRAALGRAGAPRLLAEPASLTLAATIATAPVAAAAFGTFSPVALPANVAAAPLVAPATWLGMVAALAGQVDPGLAAPLSRAAGLPAHAILGLAGAFSAVPFAQVRTGVVAAAGLSVAAGAGIMAAARGRTRKPALAVAACALAATVLAAGKLDGPGGPGAPPAGRTRISFLDVGQGDATLLQSRGRSLLVDAGPDSPLIVERLRESGVEHLDALLVTHAQADHLGGADRVLREVGAGVLLDGRDGVREPEGGQMEREAARAQVPIEVPRAGDRIALGDLSVEVLGPEGDRVAGADPNLRCVVLRVRGPGLSLLTGADAEAGVLLPLDPGPADILKVSHHGSADPQLDRLLGELRPRLAVIEVGRDNPYGHPTAQALSSLSRAGVRTLRTDRDGTVRVEPGPGGLRVQSGS